VTSETNDNYSIWNEKHYSHSTIAYRNISMIIGTNLALVFWILTSTVNSDAQSAQMSKITNDSLTWSGTGCIIASCTHIATVGVKGLNWWSEAGVHIMHL